MEGLHPPEQAPPPGRGGGGLEGRAGGACAAFWVHAACTWVCGQGCQENDGRLCWELSVSAHEGDTE